MDEVTTSTQHIARLLEEGTRFHAYDTPEAEPAVSYQFAKVVDLADRPIPADWTMPNSTLYPRKEDSSGSQYGVDFARLFSEEFAAHYGFPDSKDSSRFLTLCELVDQGLINELWLNVESADDVSIPEVVEYKQRYTVDDQPIAGEFEPCAGNGCLDAADAAAVAACGRSLRILGTGQERGPGCVTHGYSHGIEAMGRALPRFDRYFRHFANLDFDTRLGASFDSFYGCEYYPSVPCLEYTGEDDVSWSLENDETGTFSPYDQGCGNVHFPPNARDHYDYTNTTPVLATCEHYGLRDGSGGQDLATPYTSAKADAYEESLCDGYCDCGGGWNVYWMQNFPSFGTQAVDGSGSPMRSWWPYLFY